MREIPIEDFREAFEKAVQKEEDRKKYYRWRKDAPAVIFGLVVLAIFLFLYIYPRL